MLKLPPIADRLPVRHVIQLPPELDEALRSYASAYAQAYGKAKPVAELIPPMLASFIEGDRSFARWRRNRPSPGARTERSQ